MLTLKSVIYDDRIENWQIDDGVAVPHNILIFVVSGKVKYWLNGVELDLVEGDVLFIASGTVRTCKNDEEGPHQKYSAHFNCSPEIINALLPMPDRSYFKCRIRNTDYFKQRFSMLLLQWFDREAGHTMICEGILLELLGLTQKERQRNRISEKKENLVNRLRNYIVHNHCKPIRLTDLAEYVDRSPNHITKIFKEVLNQTPINYINQVKVSIACELLRSSNMTVSEIAEHLGYCEPSYFHRIFKKYTGVSPSTLQKDFRM